MTTEAQRRREENGGERTGLVIGAAIEVHRILGPGLLESIYEHCLSFELEARRVRHNRQVPLDVNYKGLRIAGAHRVDLLVERKLVVEIKTVRVLPVHRAQLLTYMKLTGCRLGLVLNFNVARLSEGIVRMAL